jgi:hypothetical protein
MVISFSNYLKQMRPLRALLCDRPLVVIQSDDWGMVGIRDGDGFRSLQSRGLNLGSHPHDFYSLETAEDLYCIYEMLSRHTDSIGRHPSIVFNFVMANVDFKASVESGFQWLPLMPLDQGLPGFWERPGLLDAYREGIRLGFIYPAFHGLTHFCQPSVKKILAEGGDRTRLLRTLYESDTPLLYYRTPWVGFEYLDESEPPNGGRWLDLGTQQRLIDDGVAGFKRIFGHQPTSACAPGYRANPDTRRAWAASGIRIAQNGPGLMLAPYFDDNGLLQLYRNASFEPALDLEGSSPAATLQAVRTALASAKPAIICSHSINFHSTLKNNRDVTLSGLDRILTTLEDQYEDLIYAHDGDLLDIACGQTLQYRGQSVSVGARRTWQQSLGAASRLSHPLIQSAWN